MGISEEALIRGEEIMKFIPQRSPIVMVDEFFGTSDGVSVSGLTIAVGNLFCEGEEFGESGIIEHIAQSAALRVGYLYRNRGEEVPLGYIGGINKCRIFLLPRVGDTLRTEIIIEQEVMNITLISATVRRGEEPVAECMMKIYLQYGKEEKTT